MANIAIFRINYKSDFILTLNSDAGWLTPFCIKFWTGAPSQAYLVGFDGTTYTHCAPVAGEPTKLLVQFDDHHLPIGDLKFQIGYHFTVADFPTSVEDEVINQASVIIDVDGAPAKVMLDLNGETAPEIKFSLPAYANEAQRIENEQQRIENEQQRIDNEQQRIDNEQTRQRNEEIRIENEQERVREFGQMKGDLEQATRDAAAAAENANEKAVYAKNQGDYAKQQGDTAKADHERAEDDHRIAGEDHTQAGTDHTRAGEDHTQAGSDHTRAGEDHTRAGEDHTRAESDHAAMEVFVDSLGAFDISAYHATGGVLAKYADLTAALGTNGANVPDALRKGGMSVKFVQSSDNKYVQYRLMADEFSTTVADWQGVDNEPVAGSENLVKSGGVYSRLKSLYNNQQRNVFIGNGGKFYIEETKTIGGSVFFRYSKELQFLTDSITLVVGDFESAVLSSGLDTVLSPLGVTTLEIPSTKVLVVSENSRLLGIKDFVDVEQNDIVLLYCVAGRVSLGIDEILVDLLNRTINTEIDTINTEIFDVEKGSQLSIAHEENRKGLNADGTLFINPDFITCSYDVVGSNTYYITGRQPALGCAVACAYDSNGFVTAYTYTPSTDIVDMPITIPPEASILKVCISGIESSPNRKPSVYNSIKVSKIDALDEKTEALDEQIQKNVEIVPSYWETLLATKETSIIDKIKTIGYNGDSFVFITDIHWHSFNFGKSPVLIKHILDNTSISNIFVGGDVAQNGTISETMGFVGNIKKFTNRMFATPGNHDVSLSQFYSIFGKLAENYTDTKKSTDYYLDNASQKMRYIFLITTNGSTPISQSQVTFLNNCVSSLDSDWTVVVITHIIWNAAVVSENPTMTVCGQSVMDAVDGLVENTQATIAAIICGHLHRDWDGQTTGGIKVIGTTCDANGGQAVYDPVTPTRTAETTSEQCFDVFSIDTSNKKIYTTRIGGNGADREFTY